MCAIAAFAIVIRPSWEVDTACTSGLDDPPTLRVAASLDGFLDFAGLEAASADIRPRRLPVQDHADVLEVRVVAARLREGHRAERQLERAGDRHDGDVLAVDARAAELGERRLEQAIGYIAVEARQHDRDALPRSLRRALEEIDAVRNVERAGRM